ncbi:helix-turn-helix domain-containing protein [Rhizobium laguerreae]|uniref:helix-turn-helix domain-containing protein n=1 Tax=Rhizobium laguerreae TaxID=1076926 RepID=UPI001C921B0D|nr:helix-turn-helix transcriptional regulator [Rhizobium laguerreae]MBY3495351.1 helix-turn-helix domain-containing protein [Rhizobium laguerreae]
METFAALLRAARALTGETQETVGKWVDLDPQDISRWETSRYKLLSASGVALQKAFERKGIEFLSESHGLGRGVRWREPGREDVYGGALFRAARAMAGSSMRDVENRCGVSRSFLTRLEQGRITSLNLEKHRVLVMTYSAMGILLTAEGPTWGAGVRWIHSNLGIPLEDDKNDIR